MTENENLRALLAEARIITQDSLDSNTTGFDEEFKVCPCNSCERYRSIIQRIDAALAEPVKADPTLTVREACRRRMPLDGTDAQALEHAITITERERDEARAEVARLRNAVREKERLELEAVRELDEARAEVARLGAALTQETRLSLRTQRQLDEARAEVERLRSLKPIGTYSMDWNHEQERMTVARAAYQRGAEAMREAAAQLVSNERRLWLRSELVFDIRALPLPEDKHD